jgi:hypothetical protein
LNSAVTPVRVLLDDLPTMLRSIVVDAVSARNDVELVEGDANAPARDFGRVDVVLTAADNPHDGSRAGQLLAAWPQSRILLVASSGRQAVMYELHPRQLVLGDVSPTALVSAICHGFNIQLM